MRQPRPVRLSLWGGGKASPPASPPSLSPSPGPPPPPSWRRTTTRSSWRGWRRTGRRDSRDRASSSPPTRKKVSFLLHVHFNLYGGSSDALNRMWCFCCAGLDPLALMKWFVWYMLILGGCTTTFMILVQRCNNFGNCIAILNIWFVEFGFFFVVAIIYHYLKCHYCSRHWLPSFSKETKIG